MRRKKLNRKYKDRLFRLIFQNKEDLLALYNAINGSDYKNTEDLEITTLDDVIYMSMKNDVSFLIDDVLNLYEHQSSYNPNMGLRGLFYFSSLYQEYIDRYGLNIYSSSLKRLPVPRYIVLYNGTKDEPDRKELRLSDAFIQKENIPNQEPCIEVKAIMININYGNNKKMMEQCRKLKEYAEFIDTIRRFQKEGMGIEPAVDNAIAICIENGVLADILSAHRAEVMDMIITEYDEKRHMEMERDEWLQEGIQTGEDKFSALTLKLLEESRTEDLARASRDKAFREKLYREYHIK